MKGVPTYFVSPGVWEPFPGKESYFRGDGILYTSRSPYGFCCKLFCDFLFGKQREHECCHQSYRRRSQEHKETLFMSLFAVRTLAVNNLREKIAFNSWRIRSGARKGKHWHDNNLLFCSLSTYKVTAICRLWVSLRYRNDWIYFGPSHNMSSTYVQRKQFSNQAEKTFLFPHMDGH